jgi:preprotein translocase subunit YajC
MIFATSAYAMGGTGGQGATGMVQFLPLIAMFAIFYFLLIRPQQKRAREHRAMLDALKKGDDVVTQGGIHGRITGITDDVATVEIAPDVKVRVQRSAIATVKKTG